MGLIEEIPKINASVAKPSKCYVGVATGYSMPNGTECILVCANIEAMKDIWFFPTPLNEAKVHKVSVFALADTVAVAP